ncbi:MAG: hypothetical protein KGL35_05995, partial [Bradyrhizobium sp.]|nr:hypothetical protein [Bradyrhizobium sp.]
KTARGLLNARLSSAYKAKERPQSGQLAPVAPRPPGGHPPPLPSGDGKHASRVAADLAARKARNEERSAT